MKSKVKLYFVTAFLVHVKRVEVNNTGYFEFVQPNTWRHMKKSGIYNSYTGYHLNDLFLKTLTRD